MFALDVNLPVDVASLVFEDAPLDKGSDYYDLLARCDGLDLLLKEFLRFIRLFNTVGDDLVSLLKPYLSDH